jgi:hypothetical protein
MKSGSIHFAILRQASDRHVCKMLFRYLYKKLCSYNGIVSLCKTECGLCGVYLLPGKALGCHSREKKFCTAVLIHVQWEGKMKNKNLENKIVFEILFCNPEL